MDESWPCPNPGGMLTAVTIFRGRRAYGYTGNIFLWDVLVSTVENWYLNWEYLLSTSNYFINYKVTTARQLRISKSGSMSRMNLNERSYSNNYVLPKIRTSIYSRMKEQRLTKIVYLVLVRVRLVSDSLLFYAYPRIILRYLKQWPLFAFTRI